MIIVAQTFPTLTQGLLGLLVLLAAAGLGGGVRLYGDMRSNTTQTKNIDNRLWRVEDTLDDIRSNPDSATSRHERRKDPTQCARSG